MQDELDQLFQAIFKLDVARRVVTRSAISQARRKISHRAFVDLLDAVCGFINKHAPLVTYSGMRVFAIDGSTFRLPDLAEVRNVFGTARNKKTERAMGRISILHDVLNRITYDAILNPYSSGEGEMAWRHLDESELPQSSLILLDRGYVDFTLLRNIYDLGHHFCVRLKSNLKVTQIFKQSGLAEMCLQFKPSSHVRRQSPPESRFRQGFTVRLVRYKIGKKEYILMTTLLDTATFPLQDLFDLYHTRWQVEESYKVKKCRMRIEDVSGTTVETIRQDFHAKVFAECFTTALMLEVRDAVEAYCMTTRNEYKVSLTQALAKMKNTLVLLFLRARPDRLISDLLTIFTKSLIEAAPGRKYRRKNRGKGKNPPKLQTQTKGYRYNR